MSLSTNHGVLRGWSRGFVNNLRVGVYSHRFVLHSSPPSRYTLHLFNVIHDFLTLSTQYNHDPSFNLPVRYSPPIKRNDVSVGGSPAGGHLRSSVSVVEKDSTVVVSPKPRRIGFRNPWFLLLVQPSSRGDPMCIRGPD